MPRVLSLKDGRRFLDAVDILQRSHSSSRPEIVLRTLLVLLYFTGLRAGEALRLIVADVDLEDAVLHVRDIEFGKAPGRRRRGSTRAQSPLPPRRRVRRAVQAREWRIPALRMKAATKHRDPLTDVALAVLESVRPQRDRSGLPFPSPLRPGRPMSDMGLTKVLRDTGPAGRAIVHDFRTSYRTWASERTRVS